MPQTRLREGPHLFEDKDRDNLLNFGFQILSKLAERIDNRPRLSRTYLDCYRTHLLEEVGFLQIDPRN